MAGEGPSGLQQTGEHGQLGADSKNEIFSLDKKPEENQ
jgi:hypothetical protein